jgi:hypothetical protein
MANFASKDAKFPATFFYAPDSSEDNAVIENFKDSVTNNHSNTNIKIEHHLRIIKHKKRHASSLIALSRICTQKESEIRTSGHGQCK